ncbi:hypothetical protein [Dactylosporangium sp. CA-139066]
MIRTETLTGLGVGAGKMDGAEAAEQRRRWFGDLRVGVKISIALGVSLPA